MYVFLILMPYRSSNSRKHLRAGNPHATGLAFFQIADRAGGALHPVIASYATRRNGVVTANTSQHLLLTIPLLRDINRQILTVSLRYLLAAIAYDYSDNY